MNRHIGLQLRDGTDVDRETGQMSPDDLAQLGHAHVSPLRALRLKCLDCCNTFAREVRLCTAVGLPELAVTDRVGRTNAHDTMKGEHQHKHDTPDGRITQSAAHTDRSTKRHKKLRSPSKIESPD